MIRMLIVFLLLSECISAQWTTLSPMPEPVSNNAVVGVRNLKGNFVYSFGGISTGKTWSDIHKKCFKYNMFSDTWSQLPDLPKGNGRIAAGASYLRGKVYVVGGYEVFSSSAEKSFNDVHVFNPIADTFETDAATTIIPIDDHVQDTWRDSLLYVISGWSNSGNVADVQIYNPTTNEWKLGTPVPNSTPFKVFGASGAIVGDTIYYSGGARELRNFPTTNYIRKGIIDPTDPYKITWSIIEDDNALGYRMACSTYDDQPFWLGGSTTSYNYDGIAYNGSGGVAPTDLLRIYDINNDTWELISNAIPPTMDFRGIAKLSQSTFIIAGGMNDKQEVIDQCIRFDIDSLTSVGSVGNQIVSIYPNPATDYIQIPKEINGSITIIDRQGREKIHLTKVNNQVDISALNNGIYFLKYQLRDRIISQKLIKI